MTDITDYPEMMGRYKIIKLIGEGATAQVLEAYDPEIDRHVAMKVLRADVDAEYQQRFLSEAKAAGALSHPNIATIFDVGQTQGRSYITIELLEQETLADKMNSGEPLGLKQVLSIAIDLAKALAYAHSKGVVHRDIKPANIMFTAAGVAKISDFGIARRDNSSDLQTTQVGTVLGTPRYMSPEQAIAGELDGRSDLYALGVILYELLSGKRAFDASTMTSLLLQITQEEPVPINKIAPHLPLGLSKIVSKLLRKRPEKRFQSGAELVATLENELEVIVEQERDRERNKYIPLKVKWAAAMGGVVALVLLLSMTWVYRVQVEEITTTVTDSGSSLAKFIATQAAIPVLSEDWISLEAFVSEASARNAFEFLQVVDHTGVVRASTDVADIGFAYKIPESLTQLKIEDGSMVITEIDRGGEFAVFNFDTPILFQETEVGRVYMGLSREGLDELMGTTLNLMLLIAIVTLASVILVMYVVTGLLAKPIALLTRSMEKFGDGQFDLRISNERSDEIGELYSAFNNMGDHLQNTLGVGETANQATLSKETINRSIDVELPAMGDGLNIDDTSSLKTVIAVRKK